MNQKSTTSGQSDIEELKLHIQKYAASQMIAADMSDVKLALEVAYDYSALILVLSHRLPADVLQQDKEICRYPASNWQWLKQFIPFAKPKYKIHYLTEHVTFPKMKYPKKMQDEMRIFIEHGMRTGNWDA